MLNWALLIVAIAFEVAGTTSMKLSRGFTRLLPTLLMFIFYGCGLTMMNLVIRRMDLSLVYAVWSGLGTAAIALIGILWFHEPATALRIVSIILIILGVVGLNLRP
ncbi:DMT family transporter [Leptolinea tardivitalis]|uniref:Membrane protein n=1 Tax=Leptolinea tardivitalis TaxID=229920 RepID=A0A0P6XJB7_9CHLR|nr:multidrug efflux SMR transporter [Leptolinea tardivitalis]KPL71325.1 membrane protein [Leptolinea tardivitalis]GAP23103.1 membrane transporter of cations and cationic drugs [Leptolinea tardivitalis]